jgi:hypothetical protein
MGDYLEHSHRWQHRTHAAPTGHWHDDRYVLGSVEACEDCGTDQDGAA